jgi:hypothetical protein
VFDSNCVAAAWAPLGVETWVRLGNVAMALLWCLVVKLRVRMFALSPELQHAGNQC